MIYRHARPRNASRILTRLVSDSKLLVKNQKRSLSQHLQIVAAPPPLNLSTTSNTTAVQGSDNISADINFKRFTFNVNLMKVPSNYGYFSSRVNRLYNEDRYQVGVLDIDLKQHQIDEPEQDDLIADTDVNNEWLERRIDKVDDPVYRNKYQHDKVFNFSVFDGHGGNECSEYLTKHLLENVEKFNINDQSIQKLFQFYAKKISGYWRRYLKTRNQNIIKNLNLEKIINLDEIDPEVLKKTDIWNLDEFKNISGYEFFKFRVFLSYLYTDYQFLMFENNFNNVHDKNTDLINSGSTCTSMFLYSLDKDPQDPNGYFYEDGVLSRLLVAHLGDTRAILCDRNGVAHPLTQDHHPSNPTEAKRLRRLSAGLIMTDSFGEERYLNFANTRSFGDISAKNVGVTAEPEFFEYLIGDAKKLKDYKAENKDYLNQVEVKDFGGDECFLVLISDGVTNHLSDQEVVDLIMATTNNKGLLRGTPGEAAKEVVQFVECIGGDDNATCSVVRLKGWGHWPIIDRTGKLREEKMMSGASRRGR